MMLFEHEIIIKLTFIKHLLWVRSSLKPLRFEHFTYIMRLNLHMGVWVGVGGDPLVVS